MRTVLPAYPRQKQLIDIAVRNGCRHVVIRGNDILQTADRTKFVVLQPIHDDAFYTHAVASAYARVLGLDIQPDFTKSDWNPSDSEQT
ncbi:hypothetical protein [Rhodoplanes elegans]|uniref:hypothetical protein n=1 Tax=Rhodoplanes elegans TaxID=29408 RepID=UPI0011B94780|nr:hypothetical protein [Rhodoplanes elegans]